MNKKLIIIAVCWVIIVASVVNLTLKYQNEQELLLSPSASIRCIDSDNTNIWNAWDFSYFSSGEVKLNGRVYKDSKSSDGKIREYYCFRNRVLSRIIACSNGVYEDTTKKASCYIPYNKVKDVRVKNIQQSSDGGTFGTGILNKIEISFKTYKGQFKNIEIGECNVDIPEDVDSDGSINAIDVQMVINGALNIGNNPCADIDRSGKVDAIDVQMVINGVLGLIMCSDHTISGSCSTQSPLYCNSNGQLINNCNICGCASNIMQCVNNQCIRRVISSPNYKCTFCQGFCYTNDGNTVSVCTTDNKYFEWPKDELSDFDGKICQYNSDCSGTYAAAKCINGRCVTDLFDHPWGFPIVITPSYPRSVSLNQNFNYIINIKNLGSTPLDITVYNPSRARYIDNDNTENDLLINYNVKKTIQPNSEESFTILVPGFNSYTDNGQVRVNIKVGDTDLTYKYNILPPINVYNPTSSKNCGNLIYSDKNGLCINNILYPTGYPTCLSNNDCQGDDVCINYNCIPPQWVVSPKFDTTHKVGIIPVFIYDDSAWVNQIKDQRTSELISLAKSASDWFNQERLYQNAQNNFNVNYEFYKSCSFSKQTYLALLKQCQDNTFSGGVCDKQILTQCSIDFTKYDVIAETYYYEPTMDLSNFYADWTRIGYLGVSGINFGNLLSFGLQDSNGIKDMGVLIHETLHSFGEIDLYTYYGVSNSAYQERDCILYRAGWNLFKKFPHLCDFEAKLIGWKV